MNILSFLYLLNVCLFAALRFSIPILALHRTNDPVLVSAFYFLTLIPQATSGLIVGPLSGFLGFFRYIQFLCIIYLFFVILILFFDGYVDFSITLFLYLPLIYVESLWKPAFLGFLKNTTLIIQREIMLNRVGMIDKLASAVGPLVCGLMVYFDFNSLLLGVSLLLFFASSIYILSTTKLNENTGERLSKGMSLGYGFSLVFNNPFFRFVILRFFITGIFSQSVYSSLVYFLSNYRGLSELEVSMFFGLASLGVFLTPIIVKLKLFKVSSKWSRITITGLLSSIFVVLMSFSSSVGFMLLMWLLCSSMAVINSSTFNSEKLKVLDSLEIQSVSAISLSLVTINLIPSYFLLNWLVQKYDYVHIFQGMSICLFLASAVFFIIGKKSLENENSIKSRGESTC